MCGITNLASFSNKAKPVLVNLTPWFFTKNLLPDKSIQSKSKGMCTNTLHTVQERKGIG